MFKNILVGLISLLAVCLILEIFFRLIAPKSPSGTTYGYRVVRNSDGFRDRKFAIPKPDGVKRILVLGDSFTWGVGMNIHATIPKILERKLRGAFKNIEVVNGAIPGDNTVRQLNRFVDKGLKYEPDILFLVYSLNDIEYIKKLSKTDYGDKKTGSDFQIEKERNFKKYSERYGLRGFIRRLEKSSAFIAFMVPRVGEVLRRLGLLNSTEFSWVEKIFAGYTDENPGWLESKRALKELKDLCRQHGIELVMAIHPLLKELENYQGGRAHSAIKDYARQLNIPVIDLLPVFENKKTSSLWINYADSHPNEAANRLVADYVAPFIIDLVEGLDLPQTGASGSRH